MPVINFKKTLQALCFTIITCLFPYLQIPIEASADLHQKFIYHIYWSGIRAGQAELFIDKTSAGTTIKTRATSSDFISLFYRVDDRAVSKLYPDDYPERFTLRIREGRHRRHKITNFGRYTDGVPQEIIFNNVLDDEITEHRADKPAHDPLSAFYAMLKKNIEVGHSEYIKIFDNEKLWDTEIKVLRREKLSVKAGKFDTIVVKPLLQSDGIFLKKGDMHIWVTDDDRKIPVKFSSKAIVGHFYAVLAAGDY